MSGQSTRQTGEDGPCPKRLWVMNTLADDDAVDAAGKLPRGLAFHLSRCPSCKTLADQLLGIGDGLCSLAGAELPETLGPAANSQLEKALRDGARLTGRISVATEPDAEAWSTGPPSRYRSLPYAAAACIALVAGLMAIWGASGTGDQLAGTKPGNSIGESPSSTGDVPLMAPLQQPLPSLVTEVQPTTPTEAETPGDGVGSGHDGCRHTSEVDALMCERGHPIERAVQLPRRPQRKPSRAGKPPEPIDNSRTTMSTMQKPDGQRKDR